MKTLGVIKQKQSVNRHDTVPGIDKCMDLETSATGSPVNSTVVPLTLARKGEILSEVLATDTSPEHRLKLFVFTFSQLVHDNPDFGKLMQQEIMAGDDVRLRLLAEQVFLKFFSPLLALCKELDPRLDPHMLAVSIVWFMAGSSSGNAVSATSKKQQGGRTDPLIMTGHITHFIQEFLL